MTPAVSGRRRRAALPPSTTCSTCTGSCSRARPRPAAAGPADLRTVQNWVGGCDHSPRGALFVPPQPGLRRPAPRRPGPLLQPYRPRPGRPGRDRPRPVRDHPPVHRRQRPHRPGARPRPPAPPGPGQPHRGPGLHGAARRRRRLLRGPRRLPRRPARRLAHPVRGGDLARRLRRPAARGSTSPSCAAAWCDAARPRRGSAGARAPRGAPAPAGRRHRHPPGARRRGGAAAPSPTRTSTAPSTGCEARTSSPSCRAAGATGSGPRSTSSTCWNGSRPSSDDAARRCDVGRRHRPGARRPPAQTRGPRHRDGRGEFHDAGARVPGPRSW